MAEKRLFKELKQLVKNPPIHSNAQILQLSPVDEESSIYEWSAVIAKPTKDDNPYYYNGEWKLDIVADKSYPIQPPKIKFSRETPINHPNVNLETGEICLDILKSDAWSPAWNLEHLVVAILMLIDTPEPDSPLNVDLANLFRTDKQGFESIVQYTMWKYSTLYEGHKDPSGVQTWSILAYDISSEEEDNDENDDDDDDEVNDGNKDDMDEGVDEEMDEEFDEDMDQNTEDDDNDDVEELENIEEMEETNNENVTQEETLDEIPDASLKSTIGLSVSLEPEPTLTLVESSVEHIQSVADMTQESIRTVNEILLQLSPVLVQSAQGHVTKNVPKQVDEIFRNTGRHRTPPRKEEKKDLEKIKKQFFWYVDNQIDEVRRLHEWQRAVVQ